MNPSTVGGNGHPEQSASGCRAHHFFTSNSSQMNTEADHA